MAASNSPASGRLRRHKDLNPRFVPTRKEMIPPSPTSRKRIRAQKPFTGQPTYGEAIEAPALARPNKSWEKMPAIDQNKAVAMSNPSAAQSGLRRKASPTSGGII